MACENSCISAEATKEFLEYIKTYIDEYVPESLGSEALAVGDKTFSITASTPAYTKSGLALALGVTEADIDAMFAGEVSEVVTEKEDNDGLVKNHAYLSYILVDEYSYKTVHFANTDGIYFVLLETADGIYVRSSDYGSN